MTILDHFAPLVGAAFEAEAADGTTCTLRLVRASVTGRYAFRGRIPFELKFIGPAAPALPQGTHRLRHDALGELAMFLVPLGPSDSGMLYQALYT